jgi:hypothetical protein
MPRAPLQLLQSDSNHLLAIVWCKDEQVAAFRRFPTVLNVDDTRM